MKTAYYPRLAHDGIRKNKRMFIPYIITTVCMISMFYILCFLSSAKVSRLIPHGASTAGAIFSLGSIVILLFSLIFLFYTNSFIIRSRAREFGLYNVLGMSKRNLACIIALENLIIFLISLALGLIVGISLSKLAELVLVNMLSGNIDLGIHIDGTALTRTVLFYSAIFALIMLVCVIRVYRKSASELLKSENVGEKPPRANPLFGAAGIVILAAAYRIAVGITNPVSALLWFFAAVLMVIAATYLIMISGSVLLCRLLQKNKRYYYHPKHFVSVSSMVYRMKRNGAGLASICIIGTMVLVMLSSSACLWIGSDRSIRARCPGEINLDVHFADPAQLSEENVSVFRSAVKDYAAGRGTELKNEGGLLYIGLTGLQRGGELICGYDDTSAGVSFADLRNIVLISREEYAAISGEYPELEDDETLLLVDRCRFEGDEFTLTMEDVSRDYRIKETRAESVLRDFSSQFIPTVTAVLSDPAAAIEDFDALTDGSVDRFSMEWKYYFDTGLSDEENGAFARGLDAAISSLSFGGDAGSGYNYFFLDSRADESADFYASNGSLFFIGVMLSVVFLLAAVLIIYYKQLSEGYEDSKRFAIMQNVGMTGAEIRGSINSQLLTVFFLPLFFAGLHLTFAFPMIRRILTFFALYDLRLFIITTVVSFAAFAVFYMAVYKLTSNAYYRIVKGASKQSVRVT